MTRDDLFYSVPTDDATVVNLSASDEANLLQIGQDGDFRCAYMDDDQLKQLADNIQSYLTVKPNQP